MIFNSIPFLFFILLFFGFWPLVKQSDTKRWVWICAMSFVFYGWWDWRFLLLLIGTGSIDYFCGKGIVKTSHKKFYLWLSIITNLLSLLIFKYSGFIADSLDHVFKSAGYITQFKTSIPEFTLVLPVGISFYTFNSLSYTIDLYRGKAKSADSWLHFMAFISFFPHLVAGPIIRARDILSQLKVNKHVSSFELLNGVKTCIYGFAMKMLIADNLAVFVNANFSNATSHYGTITWWLCMLAFTFQIYFDFNGYSTIARGIAKLCGIHFKLNFNHPYQASSFQNFWRRWHISLSYFFRDYVYIPLGGNKGGWFKASINQWTTMLISGLWHGASWLFILWGAMHALFLSIERVLKAYVPMMVKSKIWYVLVFVGVVLAWVVFRADSVGTGIHVYKQLLSWHSGQSLLELLKSNAAIWLIIAVVVEYSLFKNTIKRLYKLPYAEAFVLAFLVAAILLFRGPEQQFIYFQF